MTHMDPFAPGDSPQHPANFGKELEFAGPTALGDVSYLLTVEEQAFTGETPDGWDDEIERRDNLYQEALDNWGTADEVHGEQSYVSMADLLRRQAEAEAGPDRVEEYNLLLADHGTAEELDTGWFDGPLPSFDELVKRRNEAASLGSVTVAELDTAINGPVEPPMPKGNARREEVQAWAVEVDNLRGGVLTMEVAAEMFTGPQLREMYGPKGD